MNDTPEIFNSPRHAISFLIKNSADIMRKTDKNYELLAFGRIWSLEEAQAYNYLVANGKIKSSFNGYYLSP